MSTTVPKDLLYAGEWHLADGSRWTCTPDDVRQLQKRASDMLAAGLPIPLSWEHQPSVKPRSAAELAADSTRLTLGWLKKTSLHRDGFMEGEVEVPNEADARKLPAVRFVSPYIEWDFVDGSGRKWPGPSITHVAVTPRPVQHTQKPFALGRAIYLSLGGFTPAVQLSETPPMADDKKTDAAPDGAGKLKEVLEALRGDGYGLPDDTTMDNLLDRLHTAALTKKAAAGGLEPDLDDSLGGGGGLEEPPPAAVSMSIQKKNQALEARILTGERAALEARVKRLFQAGSLPRPTAQKALEQVKAVALSLGDDGNVVPTAIHARLEAWEEIGQQTALGQSVALSQARAVDPPGDLARKRPETREEVDKAVEAWDRVVSGQ